MMLTALFSSRVATSCSSANKRSIIY